jgi:hypothetical protein
MNLTSILKNPKVRKKLIVGAGMSPSYISMLEDGSFIEALLSGDFTTAILELLLTSSDQHDPDLEFAYNQYLLSPDPETTLRLESLLVSKRQHTITNILSKIRDFIDVYLSKPNILNNSENKEN